MVNIRFNCVRLVSPIISLAKEFTARGRIRGRGRGRARGRGHEKAASVLKDVWIDNVPMN